MIVVLRGDCGAATYLQCKRICLFQPSLRQPSCQLGVDTIGHDLGRLHKGLGDIRIQHNFVVLALNVQDLTPQGFLACIALDCRCSNHGRLDACVRSTSTREESVSNHPLARNVLRTGHGSGQVITKRLTQSKVGVSSATSLQAFFTNAATPRLTSRDSQSFLSMIYQRSFHAPLRRQR